MGATTRTTPTWNVPPGAVRDRVEELFGKADRRIAKKLIDECAVVPTGATYAELESSERAQFEDTVRRTVNNWRRKLLKSWKTEALPKPGDRQAAHEFIARLSTRKEDLERIIEAAGGKDTAKVNAIAEIRQIETLIASVKNVDVSGRRLSRLFESGDGDEQNALPFMGLLMDWKNVSNETKEALLADRGADKRDATAAG